MWLKFTGISIYASFNTGHRVTSLATPLTARLNPSLANFEDAFVFVSGGYNSQNFRQVLTSVEYYSIREDLWTSAPDMINARFGHSTCALGNVLYTFGGANREIDELAHLEQLTNPTQPGSSWLQVTLITGVRPRQHCFLSPINHREILILAGTGELVYFNDACIFDTVTGESAQTTLHLHGLASLKNQNNQCSIAPSSPNTIVALCETASMRIELVAYTKGELSPRVIGG